MSIENKPNEQQTGADIVVKTLEQQKVKWVFGVPGAKIDKVFNTLVDTSIQTVVCRHEQNVAFIAGGIGRMTGKAGVAIATSGPGVSNLVTGLATANTEGDPVIALGGAVPLSDRLKKIHQTMDSVSLCKVVTKYSAEVDSPEAVSEVLTNAFRSAESGRPGAAFVSLPMDIMMAPAKCDVLTPPAYSGAGPANAAAIEEAARLINQAKRPVVLLGLLASKPENAAAVHELIESGKVPVVGTFQAAGAVPVNLFSNFGGRVGQINNQPADEILAAGDLVISIGYDPVEYWPSIWNKGNKRPVVHLDALSADIDNSYSPAVELVGDIAATIRLLTPLVSHSGPEPSIERLLGKIAEDRQELARSSAALNGTPVHPLRLVSELQKILTPDTTLCLDMGSFHLWMARHLYSFQARQILISNGQQTLGVALPWALPPHSFVPPKKSCRYRVMVVFCFPLWNSKPQYGCSRISCI
jgi:acetolactate synthase-1/2/3 large subunit